MIVIQSLRVVFLITEVIADVFVQKQAQVAVAAVSAVAGVIADAAGSPVADSDRQSNRAMKAKGLAGLIDFQIAFVKMIGAERG